MNELDLLGRYQRALLWGGGIALSVMVLATGVLAGWSIVKDYTAEARSVFERKKDQVSFVINTKQDVFRGALTHVEIAWQANRKLRKSAAEDFISGNCRAIVQMSGAVLPQLVMGQSKKKCQIFEYADFLAIADEVAISEREVAIDEVPSQKVSLEMYYYNLDRSFLGFLPVPEVGDPLARSGARDVADLIKKIAPDIENLSDPLAAKRRHQSRRVIWVPPMQDPFTGEPIFRLVMPAFEGDRPFLVFVSKLGTGALTDILQPEEHGGSFMILDGQGRQIFSVPGNQEADPDLDQRVIRSGSWEKSLRSSDYYYQAGDFTFAEPLSDTGWTFVYTYSWRTLLLARKSVLLTYWAWALIFLSVLWGFLLLFNRNVFMPVYRNSKRVFESEELSRTIIATTPVGLGLLSMNGEVLLKNEVMRSYDNESRSLHQQLVNLYWRHRGAMVDGSDDQIIEQDLAIVQSDGTILHLLVDLIETKYLGANVLLCSVSDITTRKLLERKLEEACAAADAASQAKSSFLAAMSHEIRTPLNAILGNLELLERSELTEMQFDRLQTISSSSKALLAIINDILDFSKVESGQMTIENVHFNVINVVEQVATVFAPLADAKGLGLFYSAAVDLPQYYSGDASRVRQILLNLLSNALKFTEYGKVSITISFHTTNDFPSLLKISVSDTGMGIPDAQRSTLFQPFVQGNLSITRRFGGTGLGLALCKRLAELMGGTIALETAGVVGSTFVLSLPLQRALVDEVPTLPFAGKPVIVMLCPEPEWQSFIGEHLRHWGLQVSIIDDPAKMTAAGLPLLIFGEPRRWSFAAEDRAREQASWVIDAVLDGPRRPVVEGNGCVVSCYSIEGLHKSISLTLEPETIVVDVREHYQSAHKNPAVEHIRILIVEDHKINLALIRDQFEILGYSVDLADSGSTALELFESNQYDMIFTDLNMPGIDGYMLATSLRRRGARLPIIAITADVGSDEFRRCKKAGVTDILLKPMSLEQIDKMVCKHCGEQVVATYSTSMNKPVLSSELFRTIRSTNAESMAMIYRALAVDDLDTVREQLHFIKGVFAMINEQTVVEVCRRLERFARVRDNAALIEAMPKLCAMLDEVLNAREQPPD